MTHAQTFASSTTLTTPPLSRVTQLAVALSLILGSALVAIPQYLEYLRAGDLERKEQIAWGMPQNIASILVAAGIVTVLVFPLLVRILPNDVLHGRRSVLQRDR